MRLTSIVPYYLVNTSYYYRGLPQDLKYQHYNPLSADKRQHDQENYHVSRPPIPKKKKQLKWLDKFKPDIKKKVSEIT